MIRSLVVLFCILVGVSRGQEDVALPNCQELIPGTLDIHWDLKDSNIVVELRGTGIDEANGYMAFGFSPEGASRAQMVGGNALVGGTVDGEFFAMNYDLGSKSTCDLSSGRGVCPANEDAKLIAGSEQNGMMIIRMERPVADWPIDGSRPAIWASGRVLGDTNVPLIQFHGSSHTSALSSVSVRFDQPSTCI